MHDFIFTKLIIALIDSINLSRLYESYTLSEKNTEVGMYAYADIAPPSPILGTHCMVSLRVPYPYPARAPSTPVMNIRQDSLKNTNQYANTNSVSYDGHLLSDHVVSYLSIKLTSGFLCISCALLMRNVDPTYSQKIKECWRIVTIV